MFALSTVLLFLVSTLHEIKRNGECVTEVVKEEGVMVNAVPASLFILTSLLAKLKNPFP